MITAQSPRVESTLTRMARAAVVPGTRHVGVDAVDIDVLSHQLALGGPALERRWFTDAELTYADGAPDRLAATLAGKEAVAKVLQTGIRGPVRWKTIEILRRADGAPFVLLRAGARDVARRRGLGPIAVSLCHEPPLALAVASGVPVDRDAAP